MYWCKPEKFYVLRVLDFKGSSAVAVNVTIFVDAFELSNVM